MVILFLKGRKTDQAGYGTLLPRWRSASEPCPVRLLARYAIATADQGIRHEDEPLFPLVRRRQWSRFIRDELARVGVPGGGPRSPRRGGAAHLRAHIPDDERHKLSAAGGWVKTNRRMVEQYAGISIEATRHWSTLMCRHTTMLASHDD